MAATESSSATVAPADDAVVTPAGAAPATTWDGSAPYAQGFSTLDSEVTLDSLPVSGALPDWLAGSLLRTGPARFEVGEQPYRHWFDGLTMLHRFTFGDGAVSYGNRYIRGKTWEAAERTGKIPYLEFATDPCRSVFKRMQTMFSPEFGDNANVNIVRLGERFVTMTEAPISVQFDPETLEAVGAGFDPPGTITTAHPHGERGTGAMLNYAVKMGARNEYRFFRLGPDADTPEILARIPVKQPGYVHSFGLTERWLVLAESPWIVRPTDLLLSNRPYAENYEWQPERGTRFFLVDRETGAVSDPIVGDPFFTFHHLNAYDEADGTVVADMQVYPDASIVDALYLDRLRSGAPTEGAELRRFRIDPRAGTVTHERLIDAPVELGRINYARCNERPYRYAWATSHGPDAPFLDRLIKVDVEQRSAITWQEDGSYPGEPVFVRRPGGENEDDGVVLSVVLDTNREASSLLVLDARDLSELARAEVPHHIPFSFHGQFARS